MKIDNISDAKAAVLALSEFLIKFERTLGALGNLTGARNPGVPTYHGDNNHPDLEYVNIELNVPETMPARIMAILKESGKPMTPKELVKRYTELRWPVPASGKIYSGLLSSAYYMANKKGILKNDNGRYSIVNQ